MISKAILVSRAYGCKSFKKDYNIDFLNSPAPFINSLTGLIIVAKTRARCKRLPLGVDVTVTELHVTV